MKTKISNSADFYTALLFILIGLVAVVIAAVNYPIGTAAHMGPGGFPIIIGGILILLGLIIGARALLLGGETISPFSMRALVLILGAVLIFAVSIESLGLLLATLALVFLSAYGGWEFRIREVSILYLVLVATAVGIFVYGLGVPFPLWIW